MVLKRTQLLLYKLNSVNIFNTLQGLCDSLRSSIGINGNLKLFDTVGLTSSSSLIADRLVTESVLCSYINRMIKYLPDFGLYYGVITTCLLMNILNLSEADGSFNLISQIKKLKKVVRTLVKSHELKIKLEMHANDLLRLLKGILNSKLSLYLSSDQLYSLSLNIAKAFLSSMDEEHVKMDHLLTIVEEGREEYCTFKGILHPVYNHDICKELTRFDGCETKILLFTSLDFGDDLKREKELFSALDKSSSSRIGIVVCQKPICIRIKSFLASKSVLFFERVGEDTIRSLEYLTSACLVSHIDCFDGQTLCMAGTLTGIKLVTCGVKQYVLFENNRRSVASLLVQTRILGGINEMKAVIQQCLNTLSFYVRSPFVVPGGGCFETLLCSKLLNYLRDDAKSMVAQTLFCQSLLQGANLFPEVRIDRDNSHAWDKKRTKGSCKCGMIEKQDSVLFLDLSVNHLHEVELLGSGYNYTGQLNSSEATRKYTTFDCYETKFEALLQSLNSVCNILEIGLVVKKQY